MLLEPAKSSDKFFKRVSKLLGKICKLTKKCGKRIHHLKKKKAAEKAGEHKTTIDATIADVQQDKEEQKGEQAGQFVPSDFAKFVDSTDQQTTAEV